jgi:hypothetical protein
MIGEPEQWRSEVVRLLLSASKSDPAKLQKLQTALVKKEREVKEAAKRFLVAPPSATGEVAEALEALKSEEAALRDEVKLLQEASVPDTDFGAVADTIVRHLRIMRLHLISGDRQKVRAVLRRTVKKIVVNFDASAASASVVTGYQIKYKPDAFTVRNLLLGYSEIIAKQAEWEAKRDAESAAGTWKGECDNESTPDDVSGMSRPACR